MRVSEIYRPVAVWIGPEETLRKAAAKMHFHRVGALPVMHGDWLLGIITEHDLTRAILDEAEAQTALVGEYCTFRPSTVSLDADVLTAVEAMRNLNARHLPVVDREEVVGMISARDVLSACSQQPLREVG